MPNFDNIPDNEKDIKPQLWVDNLDGVTDILNRTMTTYGETETDFPQTKYTTLLRGASTNTRLDDYLAVGATIIVRQTGDRYRLDADGEYVLEVQHPRYLSPTTTTNYATAIQITSDQDVTPTINKNLTNSGYAWVPAFVSKRFGSKGNIAYRFEVTDTSAISVHIEGTNIQDSVKLMAKLSNSPTFDIDESKTFEDNGYAPIHTLTADSGTTITNRRSLFGTSTNLAYYYNKAVNNGYYIHFAWYLEKFTNTGTLRFGIDDLSGNTSFVKDDTLTNAFNGATLQHDRTLLEVGLTSEIEPDATKRYSVIVPEPGSTFNSATPDVNTDHFTFNGSDVTYSTVVSDPLASKWEIDVANVTSDINLSNSNQPLSWTAGEIRIADAAGAVDHGFILSGVNFESRATALMTGEALQ